MTPLLIPCRRIFSALAPRRLMCTVQPTVRPVSLLLYSYVEDAIERRKPYRAEHIELAQAAESKGDLLMAGALADPVDGGVLMFVDRPAAEAFVHADPYVAGGIVTDWTVREWTVVCGAMAHQLTPLAPMGSYIAGYDWQYLPAGADIPPGLEIRMPLDGGRPAARIPQRWQMQVWLEESGIYHRQDVTRATTAKTVREQIAREAGMPADKVVLQLDGAEISDEQTVEELRLFLRQNDLVVELRNVDARNGQSSK